jgi:hypothetical protein
MKVTVWLVDEGDVDNVDDDDELMMLMRDESIVTVFVRG